MNLPTLTTNGKHDAGIAIGIALLVMVVYSYGRHVGNGQAKEVADERVAKVSHAATLTLMKSADSLERVTRAYAALAATAKAPHVQAIARTDSADTIAVHFRHDAEHLAQDTTATRQQLTQAIDSMTQADSLLDVRRVSERNTAMNRIVALEALAHADSLTIQRKDDALQSAAKDYVALETVIRDLKGQQPGIVHRAFHGIVVVTAAAGCGGLGSLAGPAAAVGAAVACGAVAGVLAP